MDEVGSAGEHNLTITNRKALSCGQTQRDVIPGVCFKVEDMDNVQTLCIRFKRCPVGKVEVLQCLETEVLYAWRNKYRINSPHLD